MDLKYIQSIIKNKCFKNGKLISYNCRRIWWENNNLIKEYNFIISFIPDNDIPFAGKIWHVLNNIKSKPICSHKTCSNNLKWLPKGYGDFCSKSCSANSSDGKNTRSKNLKILNNQDNFQEKRKNGLISYWESDNSIDHRINLSSQAKIQHQDGILVNGLKSYYNTSFVGSEDQQKRSKLRSFRNKSDDFLLSRNKNFYKSLYNKFPNTTPLFDFNEYNGVEDTIYMWKCNICDTTFSDHIDNGSSPICPTCFPKDYSISNKEKELCEFIEHLGFEIIKNSRIVIPPKELDIYIPSKNIAIEFNGNYWHTELNNKDKNYHNNKTIECGKKNIQLIHIWEYEWDNHKDIVLSRIKSKLNLNNKIYARKTLCKKIMSNISYFINQNHIQGNCASSIQYGLYYNDILISVMTFGKSRYNKQYDYELLRFCSLKEINVIGGASKLFSAFLRDYNPNSVISYSDRRWNTGSLYSSLGFNHSHTSKPSYFYTNDYINFENRIKFQKHKLSNILDNFNPNHSEWENMKNNGYDRHWDCGTDAWVWFK